MFFSFKKVHVINLPLKKKKGVRFFLTAILRVFYLGIKKFTKNQGFQIASTLTYYTLLSLVPILAISFGIAKYLNIEEFLNKGLVERFGEQQEILEKLLLFTHNTLEILKSGWIAVIGIGVLFLSAVKLLYNMDLFFRLLWGVEDKRKVKNKVFIYLTILLLFPSYLIASGIFKVIIIQKWQYLTEIQPLFSHFTILIKITPYLMIWLLFTLIYLLLPKARVKFFSALISAVTVGTIYDLAQWGYIYFQIGVSKYSAIYSSFAALPLFLIWLQLSWIIFLFGGQLSSIINNIYKSEFEKYSNKISLNYQMALCILIVSRAANTKEQITQLYLYKELNIPFPISLILLNKLQQASVLKKIKEKKDCYYKINFEVNSFRVTDLITKINYSGINSLKYVDSDNLLSIKKTLKSIEKKMDDSSKDELIKDLDFN